MLSHAESVRLASTEWPPYVSSELKGMGYVYLIVTKAFEQAGYDPVVEFLPWHEAKQLEKHDNDALFPEYGETESDQIVCSIPITAGPIGLYKHKNSIIHHTKKHPGRNQTQALHNLRAYSFGVVTGYKNTNAFDEADFLTKKAADSDLANLRQLAKGEVDLVIGDVFVNEYYIEKFDPEFAELEFFGPSLQTRDLFVCFRKSSPNYAAKLEAFNKALEKMRTSNQVDDIIAEYGY